MEKELKMGIWKLEVAGTWDGETFWGIPWSVVAWIWLGTPDDGGVHAWWKDGWEDDWMVEGWMNEWWKDGWMNGWMVGNGRKHEWMLGRLEGGKSMKMMNKLKNNKLRKKIN